MILICFKILIVCRGVFRVFRLVLMIFCINGVEFLLRIGILGLLILIIVLCSFVLVNVVIKCLMV